MISRLFRLPGVLILSAWLMSGNLRAARLDSTQWKIMGGDSLTAATALKVLTDNNLSTCLTNQQIGIDFGCTNTIDRVYLTGTNRQLQCWPDMPQAGNKPPLGLITISVGNSWPPKIQAGSMMVPYDAGNPVDTEVDVRFSPIGCRYVLIQLQTSVVWGIKSWPGWALSTQPPNAIGLNWRVAELEIHGFNGVFSNRDAVVLDEPAPAPLGLAASELSYYLGELGGQPVPVIPSRSSRRYPGTLYRIDDLKRLAPDYGTMMKNIQAGLLPGNVNIQTHGREVAFTAWPYRCVLWSVWEFLERQGVRWLYPDAQGDSVPCGKGIDLTMLPLHYDPSATTIDADWDVASLQPWPPWEWQSLRQGYLYPWRNRWNHSWVGGGPLGGGEIPCAPAPGKLRDEYREKFDGLPHNFNSVVPYRILLAKGSNWWGYDATLGRRVRPGEETITFCMDNPDLIQWVADKAVAVDTAYPLSSQHPLNIYNDFDNYNLLPMDSTRFCQDPQFCAPANNAAKPVGQAYCAFYSQSMSDEYFNFVNSVARAVQARGSAARIGALAYADVYEPPAGSAAFPDNVAVEVCMYGAPNLPLASPRNTDLKAVWEAWRARCSHLATYDYALLHIDYWQLAPELPVPLVAGIIDRAQYLDHIGALNGGCQASLESLPYNPWNFYAYPRIRWNVKQTENALLDEFFGGYFGECAAPMRAYYQAVENYEITNNVDMHYTGYCYNITPGSFPLSLLDRMQATLAAAEQLATNWITKERVSRVREGFDWVITRRNLKGVNLSDYSPYPVVPARERLDVDLGTMMASTTARSNYALFSKGTWEFYAGGSIEKALNFKAGGTFLVSVQARAIPYENVCPVLKCHLGADGGSTEITSTNLAEYVFRRSVPAGVWDLILDYSNAAPGGNRALFISQIQITPQ